MWNLLDGIKLTKILLGSKKKCPKKQFEIKIVIHWKTLNVITLGLNQTDNISLNDNNGPVYFNWPTGSNLIRMTTPKFLFHT